MVSFFTDLFAEGNFNRDSFPIRGLFPLLHDSEKTVLLKDVDRKEIKSAPFDMGAHKAPGLDGFQAHFFQSHGILGAMVCISLCRVFSGRVKFFCCR